MPWLTAVAVLAALVAGVGAAGGWRTAAADRGPALDPAEPVRLTRWEIRWEGAELVDTTPYGSPGPDLLRVHVLATNLTDETQYQPDTGVLDVVPPDPRPDPAPRQSWGYQLPSGFDPFVARRGVLELRYPEGTRAPAAGQVTVVDVSDPVEPVPWAVLGSTTDPLPYQGRSASPDGGLLAVGVEGAMWMWQLHPDLVTDEACAGGVQLTDEEWGHHFPDTEPFALCD